MSCKSNLGIKLGPTFEKDTNGILAKRISEVVDGDFLKYVVEGGAYTRGTFLW